MILRQSLFFYKKTGMMKRKQREKCADFPAILSFSPPAFSLVFRKKSPFFADFLQDLKKRFR